MSAVAGIDLSTRALDIVLLDDDRPHAEWHRVELDGKDAWERTLRVRDGLRSLSRRPWSVWDGVRHVAIEKPMGRPKSLGPISIIVGAISASLPAELRDPARCWLVRPNEWKRGLGLSYHGKPDAATVLGLLREAAPEGAARHEADLPAPTGPLGSLLSLHRDQDALDAFCLALWTQRTLDAATAPRSGAPSPSSDDQEAA